MTIGPVGVGAPTREDRGDSAHDDGRRERREG